MKVKKSHMALLGAAGLKLTHEERRATCHGGDNFPLKTIDLIFLLRISNVKSGTVDLHEHTGIHMDKTLVGGC